MTNYLFSRAGNTPACAGKTSTNHGGKVGIRKHPRMRGEDCYQASNNDTLLETPPHARGRPAFRIEKNNVYGNTPACAGKTATANWMNIVIKKHPRMRGEDFSKSLPKILEMETPPHARGRPRCLDHIVAEVGNTPACAGKTTRLQAKRLPSSETPPHARGRLPLAPSVRMGFGNTPACAGKTQAVRGRFRVFWKHPRMRGEDLFLLS